MGVEDKYVGSNIADEKLENPAFNGGSNLVCMKRTLEVAAADDDGSVFRVFKNINANLIPVDIQIFNDAITSGTDYDLGFHETNLGDVVDKDALVDGADLSSGNLLGSPLSGLTAVGVDEVEKKIFELAGHTNITKKAGYDLTLTANTVGSSVGTISVVAFFVQG